MTLLSTYLGVTLSVGGVLSTVFGCEDCTNYTVHHRSEVLSELPEGGSLELDSLEAEYVDAERRVIFRKVLLLPDPDRPPPTEVIVGPGSAASQGEHCFLDFEETTVVAPATKTGRENWYRMTLAFHPPESAREDCRLDLEEHMNQESVPFEEPTQSEGGGDWVETFDFTPFEITFEFEEYLVEHEVECTE